MKKIRLVPYIIGIAGTALLCTYGIYTLHESGELPVIDSGQTHVEAKQTTEQEQEQAENKKIALNLPELGQSIAYVHTGYIPTNMDEPAYTDNVTYDDQKRMASWSVLLDKEHARPVIALPAKTDTACAAQQLFDGTQPITLSTYTWKQAVLPCLQAIDGVASESSQPVAVRFTFKYANDTDTIAQYVTLEAFTPKSKDIAREITFTNMSPNGVVDYSTGELHPTTTADASGNAANTEAR